LADLDRGAIGDQVGRVAAALDLGRAEVDRLAVAIVEAEVRLVRHHALREQAGERLLHIDHADACERARPEAGIEQVQDRVLDATDVLLDR
jgi:hypothetical protein